MMTVTAPSPITVSSLHDRYMDQDAIMAETTPRGFRANLKPNLTPPPPPWQKVEAVPRAGDVGWKPPFFSAGDDETKKRS